VVGVLSKAPATGTERTSPRSLAVRRRRVLRVEVAQQHLVVVLVEPLDDTVEFRPVGLEFRPEPRNSSLFSSSASALVAWRAACFEDSA